MPLTFNCSEKIFSYPISFAKHVITDVFDDNASMLKPFPEDIPAPYIRSLAMCMAFAALPPLPQIKILFLVILVFFISSANFGTLSKVLSFKV